MHKEEIMKEVKEFTWKAGFNTYSRLRNTQQRSASSNSIIETREKGVTYVQSYL